MNLKLTKAIEYTKYGWRILPLHSINQDGSCTCMAGHNCESKGNAKFDVSFIGQNAKNLGFEFRNEVLDTLVFARKLLPCLDNHQLHTVAEKLGVKMLRAHRAKDDAVATAEIFLKLMKMLKK